MRSGSFLPLNDDGQPVRMREIIGLRPAPGPAPKHPLPFYVEPMQEEALFSWLMRLVTRMGVSMHALASCSFGIEDRYGHTRWWCRPHPWLLMRISERTDVGIARLRPMTFEAFQPTYRDDEASARFAGRRHDARAPSSRSYRFAVCARCLKDDARPFLRLSWLIGWMSVCPHHGTVLIERCENCSASLRVAPFATTASFAPSICTRCNGSLLKQVEQEAHPSALLMQSTLFQGKTQGVSHIEGLGRFTWEEMVSLIDVLMGTLWTDLIQSDRERIFQVYADEVGDLGEKHDGLYDTRHGSLRFIAWLLQGWPDSQGAEIGRRLLVQWLRADRNRLCRHLRPPGADPWTVGATNFGSTVRQRLELLAGAH
jgi:hypothetical protein